MDYEPKDISTLIRGLAGKLSWGGSNGHGSWLSLNFGEPSLRVRKPRRGSQQRRVDLRGEYWLWVELGKWKLVAEPGHVICTSDSSKAELSKAAAALDGLFLHAIEHSSAQVKTRFHFESGMVLLVSRHDDSEPEEELWYLYSPEMVLMCMPDGTLNVCAPHETREEGDEYRVELEIDLRGTAD